MMMMIAFTPQIQLSTTVKTTKCRLCKQVSRPKKRITRFSTFDSHWSETATKRHHATNQPTQDQIFKICKKKRQITSSLWIVFIFILSNYNRSFILHRYGTWSFGVWKTLGVNGPKPAPFFGHQQELNKNVWYAHVSLFMFFSIQKYPSQNYRSLDQWKRLQGV